MILLAIDPGYRESHAVLYCPGGPLDGPPGVRECWSLPNDDMLDLLRERDCGERVLIESMDPFGLRLGRETMDTILWIGRFMEAGRAELVPRSLIKTTLCGARKADDAAIRLVLLDRFGGAEKAIGGGACPTCQGKGGWGRKPYREICAACRGTKRRATGPLYGVTGHLWQALAVAVTWLEVNGTLSQGGDALRNRAPQTCPSTSSNPAPGDALSPGADLPLFNERRD